jgi:diguanylate cyclase (GGDEF)-like protein
MDLLHRYLRWSTLLPLSGRIYGPRHVSKMHIAQFMPLVIIAGTLGCACIAPLGPIHGPLLVVAVPVVGVALCVLLGRWQQGMLIVRLVLALQVGLLLNVFENQYLHNHTGQFTLAFLMYLIISTTGIFLRVRSVIGTPIGCGMALVALTWLRVHSWQGVLALAGPPLVFLLFSTTLVVLIVANFQRALRRADRSAELAEVVAESEMVLQEFGTMFEAVQDGLAIYDATGRELHRNSTNRAMLELPSASGRTVDEVAQRFMVATLDGTPVAPGDQPTVCLLRGQPIDAIPTYVLHRMDGTRQVIQVQALPLLGPTGQLTGVLEILHDITTEFRQQRQNAVLRAISHACSSALDEHAIAEAAIRALVDGLHVSHCAIAVRDDARPGYARVVAQYLSEDTPLVPMQRLMNVVINTPIAPDAPFLSLRVLASGIPVLNEESLPWQMVNDGNEEALLSFTGLAILPLMIDGSPYGILYVGHTTSTQGNWSEEECELLLAVADEIAMALHRARLYEEAQRLAWRDPLTGLHNHRALQARLREAIATATAAAHEVAVIMLDVDHFRQFNERHGHDVGDLALQTVAQAMHGALRVGDFVARYGGEEFTIVLPEADAAAALHVAERVRAAIAQARVRVGDAIAELPITASLGFAIFPAHASTPATLLKAADLALYCAKHAGRNCVCAYIPEQAEASSPGSDALAA